MPRSQRYLANRMLKDHKILNSVADPDPESGAFLSLDPGWEKIQSQDPGSGMNIPDLVFQNLV
jgi:hypothetical protein